MEKAYIILVHRNPVQLYRLIRKLDDNQSVFYVHIDRKTSVGAFDKLADFSDKVKLVDRVVSNWAGFGIVQATINALVAVTESGKAVQRIILLSGQDYPIKSNEYINSFLANSPHSIFLESFAIPDYNRWNPGGGIYRVNKYFFGFKAYQKYSAKAFNLLGMVMPFLKRKAPRGMIPFAGSQWWIIDLYAANYIIDYLKANVRYYRFHQSTFAPDELFFHGILLNSKDEKLLQRISNDNMRYINWQDTTKSHPELLQKADYQEILRSDALFARKFDEEVDSEIFDLIDHHCSTQEQGIREPESALTDHQGY